MGLILGGAALETWAILHRRPRSPGARAMLALGTLGAIAAVASGLSLFHAGDFQGRTLDAALMHRALGLASLGTALVAAVAGRAWSPQGPGGRRLGVYRVSYLLAASLVGLTGHYGGWIVFGWGRIWTL